MFFKKSVVVTKVVTRLLKNEGNISRENEKTPK